jgi:hypothetical protein
MPVVSGQSSSADCYTRHGDRTLIAASHLFPRLADDFTKPLVPFFAPVARGWHSSAVREDAPGVQKTK